MTTKINPIVAETASFFNDFVTLGYVLNKQRQEAVSYITRELYELGSVSLWDLTMRGTEQWSSDLNAAWKLLHELGLVEKQWRNFRTVGGEWQCWLTESGEKFVESHKLSKYVDDLN